MHPRLSYCEMHHTCSRSLTRVLSTVTSNELQNYITRCVCNKFLQNPSHVTGTVLGAGHTADSKDRNGPYSHGIFQSSPSHSIIGSIPKYKVYWLHFVLCACYSRVRKREVTTQYRRKKCNHYSNKDEI